MAGFSLLGFISVTELNHKVNKYNLKLFFINKC